MRLLDADEDDSASELANIVKDRRNTIVHDGTDVQITQTDLNLLKSLSTGAIERIGELSKLHETEQIIAYLTTDEIPTRISELEHDMDEAEQKLFDLKKEFQILEEVHNW